MTTLGTLLCTWLLGERVGSDRFGNRYYRRRAPAGLRERRWVLYNGLDEASKVPAEWHGWLHHTLEKPPTEAPLPAQPWEREHRPNLTGTELAYRPPGSDLAGGARAKTDGDYEPWRP